MTPSATPPQVPLELMVGQLVMAGMSGITADPDLLRRVRQGEVGGIVLFAGNVSPALPEVLAGLQAEARAGGNPPLLISVDQEGGLASRLPGPPAPPRSIASPAEAFRQGQATATFLEGYHINVDLAPVADVDQAESGFEVRQGRGYAGNAARVAGMANAFTQGLQRQGVAATAKHFPGIGSLKLTTDAGVGRVSAPARQLEIELQPFEAVIDDGVDLVMLANAVYEAWDPGAPAVFSPSIVQDLLRRRFGYDGVVITDDLALPPIAGSDVGARAVLAVQAGADVALYSPVEAGPVARQALLVAAQSGALPHTRVEEAYQRVTRLKARLAGPAA